MTISKYKSEYVGFNDLIQLGITIINYQLILNHPIVMITNDIPNISHNGIVMTHGSNMSFVGKTQCLEHGISISSVLKCKLPYRFCSLV